MERKTLWGLILAAAVLVGLGAWLLGRSSGDDDERGDDRAATSQTEAGRDRLRARPASVRPALDTLPKAAITGSVRDVDGAPIDGAQVCAWPRVHELEGHAAAPRCTKSEADGRYRLDGLMPVRAVVNAEARGYLPHRWFASYERHREDMLELRAGETREGVDFELRPGGAELRGVVRDISGGVVEGAFVWVGSMAYDESGRSAAWTDEDGRFSLWIAPGRLAVKAEAEGYAASSRFTAVPGPIVEVVLTPESAIKGRVIMAGTGEPVAGVVVEAKGANFFSEGSGRNRSDDAGGFLIAGLAPGLYKINANSDELHGEGSELVHLGLAQTAEGVVVELHPAFVVSGRVSFAGGSLAGTEARPCPQGTLRLQDRDDQRNSKYGRITPTGEVEIRAVLPGVYTVEVDCTGAVSEPEYADLEVRSSNVVGLGWEVREGQAIHGEVVDADGSPVEGMQVFVNMKSDPADPRKQLTRTLSDATLADGRFSAHGLLPGTYELRLFASERPVDDVREEVVLEPGAELSDLRLELPAAGTLIGIVRDADGDPVPAVQLRASASSRVGAIGVSDDDGRFVINHVEPGEVRILAMDGAAPLRAPGTTDDDPQGTVAVVEVGETTEVEIVIESRKASIRGRVLDEHGSPVADAFVSHQRVLDSANAGKSMNKHRLRSGFNSAPVLTDADGHFVLEGLAEGSTYVLGAFRKGGGEALAEGVQSGEFVELTIVATGEIAGTVVVDGGALPDRVKLTISNRKEGLTRTQELFRTGGAFRMKELPPGTYDVVADSSAGSARVEALELAAGETKDDVVLTLVPRVTVRGRVIDLVTREAVAGISVSVGARGTSMSFGPEKAGNQPHISDADGRFEVADALSGKVTLALLPRGTIDGPYSWLFFPYEIPAGEDVIDIGDVEVIADRVDSKQKPGDIGFEVKSMEPGADPEAFVAIVALVRPGGPAEGKLAVGDRIATVDGYEVDGTRSYRLSRMTKVAPGVSFELGLAGGKTVTITAGPPI
jgi:protocatechuate 3,4-dioxygenase beta subunit